MDEERLFANLDKIEYAYGAAWYKVGTGPLPRADWTELWRTSAGGPIPLNWRYLDDRTPVYPEAVYEYYSPAE